MTSSDYCNVNIRGYTILHNRIDSNMLPLLCALKLQVIVCLQSARSTILSYDIDFLDLMLHECLGTVIGVAHVGNDVECISVKT